VQAQPHLVPHRELSEAVAAVVLGLHQLLGVKEAVYDLFQECISVHQLPVECRTRAEPT
jgi:hypothetical protein